MNKNKYSRTADTKNIEELKMSTGLSNILTQQYNEQDMDLFHHNVFENYLLHLQNLQEEKMIRYEIFLFFFRTDE